MAYINMLFPELDEVKNWVKTKKESISLHLVNVLSSWQIGIIDNVYLRDKLFSLYRCVLQKVSEKNMCIVRKTKIID